MCVTPVQLPGACNLVRQGGIVCVWGGVERKCSLVQCLVRGFFVVTLVTLVTLFAPKGHINRASFIPGRQDDALNGISICKARERRCPTRLTTL